MNTQTSTGQDAQRVSCGRQNRPASRCASGANLSEASHRALDRIGASLRHGFEVASDGTDDGFADLLARLG